MRIYKGSYTDKKGDIHETKNWYFEIKDHLGTIRRFAGFSDRKATGETGRKIEKLVCYRLSGLTLDADLSAWLETLSPKMKVRLAGIGLLDKRQCEGSKPLSEHLDDFYHSLISKGGTLKHAQQTKQRIQKIFDDCDLHSWSDISASRIQRYLFNLMESEKVIGRQTYNYYLMCVKQFARWMIRDRRAQENPIEYLSPINARTDRRRVRRALTPEEARRLLEATRNNPERFGMSGYERMMLYLVALQTGIRAGEMRSLTVSSVDFEKNHITIRAGYTKNRRESVIELRPDTTVELKNLVVGKLPGAPIFNLPHSCSIVRMFRLDLAAAGIDYQDESGHYCDFHSLRHTFATFLFAAGVHPRTAQELMRHSSINLTMSVYTHFLTGQTSEALDRLPDLSMPKQHTATGTDRQ
jgi:integrase